MNNKIYFLSFTVPLLLALGIISLQSCFSSKQSSESKVPDDFYVMLTYHGGMILDYQMYFIKKDSSVYEVRRGTRGQSADENIYSFKVNDTEMLELYNIIQSNNPSSIKTFSREVYDRGGSSIRIRENSKFIDVSNSGMDFIEQEYQQNYNNIVRAVEELTAKKLESEKRKFIIRIDDSILNSGKIVNINVAGKSFMSAAGEVKETIEIEVLKGKYTVSIMLLNPDATGNDRIYTNAFLGFDTNEKSSMRLLLESGKIVSE